MILAETLKCTVPSPNAVKDATISCVTGATNWPDIYTAVGTCILAIFAIAAWWVARKNHKYMQHQIDLQAKANEDAKKAAKRQLRKQQISIDAQNTANTRQLAKQQEAIDASMDAAKQAREISAATDLILAADKLTVACRSNSTQHNAIRDLLNDLATKIQIFRFHQWKHFDELSPLAEIDVLLYQVAANREIAKDRGKEFTWSEIGFIGAVIKLNALVTLWVHASDQERKSLVSLLPDEVSKFEEQSRPLDEFVDEVMGVAEDPGSDGDT